MDGTIVNIAIYLSATFAAALVTGVAGFAFGLVAAAVWLHILTPIQTATLIIAFGLVVQAGPGGHAASEASIFAICGLGGDCFCCWHSARPKPVITTSAALNKAFIVLWLATMGARVQRKTPHPLTGWGKLAERIEHRIRPFPLCITLGPNAS
jgi:hypothetical protein